MTRRKAAVEVAAVLADGEWHTAQAVCAVTGLVQSAVNSHLTNLVRYPWRDSPVEMRVERRVDLRKGVARSRRNPARAARFWVTMDYYRLRPVKQCGDLGPASRYSRPVCSLNVGHEGRHLAWHPNRTTWTTP